MPKKLVIAPHVDDDVLGCGGILDSETVTLYLGVDYFHEVDYLTRHSEANAVLARTGGRFYWPGAPGGMDGSSCLPPVVQQRARCNYYDTLRRVNHFGDDLPGLIADVEGVITREHPDEVYLPWPSYNQDHRAVYDAALVALRPHDRNHFVPRVLVYEGSQINYWDWHDPGVQFHPNYFVPINLAEKLARYACMPSQERAMRSQDHLGALAMIRGGEIGVPFAEAFQILRWVGER